MARKESIETVDTNVILRLILNDVPRLREKAVRLLQDETRTFIIPNQVIIEAVFYLEKQCKYARPQTAKAIMETLGHFTNLSYGAKAMDEIFRNYVEHPALSFVDCYLAWYAAKRQAGPLWTFDHKLAMQSPTAKEVV